MGAGCVGRRWRICGRRTHVCSRGGWAGWRRQEAGLGQGIASSMGRETANRQPAVHAQDRPRVCRSRDGQRARGGCIKRASSNHGWFMTPNGSPTRCPRPAASEALLNHAAHKGFCGISGEAPAGPGGGPGAQGGAAAGYPLATPYADASRSPAWVRRVARRRTPSRGRGRGR